MDEKQFLLEELAMVKKNISDIKADIKQAKTIRFKTGQYESFQVFSDMQKQLSKNVLRQDEITAELSAMKTKKQDDLHKHFIDVCREEIGEDDFLWILNEAKRRTEEKNLRALATDASMTTPVMP